MAPCWRIAVTALLVLISVGLCRSQCDGPGIPGIPGTHGPNGRDGATGEPGEPGEVFAALQGLKGDPGPRGPVGRSGLKGDRGVDGSAGSAGRRGQKGRPFSSAIQRVVFSLKREMSTLPENDQPMDFNRPILPDPDLQEEILTNGSFVCKIPGVYFFSFHISAKPRVCLKLVKNSAEQMSLCDNGDGFLVTSSSAVLPLLAGDSVSLQTTKYNSIVTTTGASHIFNGFLISKD